MRRLTRNSEFRPKIALLTFVLQEHHRIILEDWLDFLNGTVVELIVHVGADEKISYGLEGLCQERGVRLIILGITTALETTENEKKLMQDQFNAVTVETACIVRLDTLPYCVEGFDWLSEAITLQRKTNAKFITGSTLPFRADKNINEVGFKLTQRISNCFLIIEKEIWWLFQKGSKDTRNRYGRFTVEGAAEDYAVENNSWGLRIVNGYDVRIFHCQEWQPRLIQIREKFRQGYGILPYLKGFQDDFMGGRARYYMQPKISRWTKLRVLIGAGRRRMFGSKDNYPPRSQ